MAKSDFSEHRIWIEPHESHSKDGTVEHVKGHWAEIVSRPPGKRTEIHLQHLGIYSNANSAKENFKLGKEHGYDSLTIGRHLNEAANLAEANAKKWRSQGKTETAEALEDAEKSLRKSADYAFEEHEKGH
jgi:hypothetical protein